MGFPAISPVKAACMTSTNAAAAKGATGVYGYAITGPTPGGVLLPDGSGSWQREAADGVLVKGSVVFTAGVWTNGWPGHLSWAPDNNEVSSGNDGTWAGGVVGCPGIQPDSVAAAWSQTYNRTSSLNIRFLIAAPAGAIHGPRTLSRGLLRDGCWRPHQDSGQRRGHHRRELRLYTECAGHRPDGQQHSGPPSPSRWRSAVLTGRRPVWSR